MGAALFVWACPRIRRWRILKNYLYYFRSLGHEVPGRLKGVAVSRFSRPVRNAVVGLLAVSALIIFGASPASAATGSLVDDGNGGLVVTYSSPTNQDYVVLEIHPTTSNCNSSQNALAILTNDPSAPQAAQMAASPVTIVAGTTAFGIQTQGVFTMAATSYLFCLMPFSFVLPITPLAQLTMTIGQGSPTTTTTTTAPSTTTTAAGTPVTPAFTG